MMGPNDVGPVAKRISKILAMQIAGSTQASNQTVNLAKLNPNLQVLHEEGFLYIGLRLPQNHYKISHQGRS